MALRPRTWVIGAASLGVVTVLGAVLLGSCGADGGPSLPPAWEALYPSPDTLREQALEAAVRRFRRELARMQPQGPYVVVDTHQNVLSLRTLDSLLLRAQCSTGSGHELVDSVSGRRWVFRTPRGVFAITSKLTNPWWRKPDWAFIEEQVEIPRTEAERYDNEMLGDYAMGFGDGYFIHGTLYERLLGVSVTHGCVRLGAEDLKHVYARVRIGTPVYVF